MSLVKSPDEVNQKVESFFKEVIGGHKLSCKCSFIVVNHFVPTFPYFLDGLSSIGKVALLVPKGTHRHEQSVQEIIRKGYRVLGQSRDDNFGDNQFQDFFIDGVFDSRRYLKTEKKLLNLIDKTIDQDSNFLFIDIGGYFSYFLEQVKTQYGSRFLGVVEGTENGHQKYQSALSRGNVVLRHLPIISMARSLLKKTEDYNVGKSIVDAATIILRVNAHTIIERMNLIAVIGFGIIGRSIAEHLRQRNVRQVIIYDRDPIRTMEAVSLGFSVADRKNVISKADMIFCATGNRSLNEFNFSLLKSDVFVASCTSNDDEFDISFRDRIIGRQHEANEFGHIEQLIDGEKKIYLLHKGNAVNFIYHATNGPFIYSVLVGLIVAAIKIIDGFNVGDGFTIKELDKATMENIAKIWLKIFEQYED